MRGSSPLSDLVPARLEDRTVGRIVARSVVAVLVLCVVGLYGAAVASNPCGAPFAYSTSQGTDVARRAKLVTISVEVADTAALTDTFSQVNYDLAKIREGGSDVPRLFLTTLPHDLSDASVAERKRLFIQAILPLILRTNEVILGERRRLLSVMVRMASGQKVAAHDRGWLTSIATLYGVSPDEPEALLERIDVVPPSLALAQAAEESGWGTSRFAKEGNAVFGERTFVAGEGLVPERRDADKRHEVVAFDGLHYSVARYMLNLNTHWAYDRFRRVRAQMRARSELLSGPVLAGTLRKYSERGEAYVKTIRSIIRVNGLERFDGVNLALTPRAWRVEG